MPDDEGSPSVHPQQPTQQITQQPIQHVTNVTTVNNTIVHKNETLARGKNEATKGKGAKRQESEQATATKKSTPGKL